MLRDGALSGPGDPAARVSVAHRWRVPFAGAMAALMVVAALAALAWLERAERQEDVRQRNSLVARLFAENVTRNVESAALALSTLGEMLAHGETPEGSELRAAMAQTLVNLPFLRGIALVREDGRILSSVDPSEVGLDVDLRRLGKLSWAEGDELGRFVAARRLADLRDTGARAPAGVGFLPLVRKVIARDGPVMFLVASLNAEAFISFQQAALNDGESASALLTYDGQLVGATGQVDRPSGDDCRSLPPFGEFLPSRERGEWVGRGLRPGEQIGAFNVSATRPLVVLVETDRQAVLEGWLRQARPMALAGASVVALIALMTVTAARSQRARQAAQRERDAAQAAVARRERELAVTIENLHELVFRADAQGRIVLVNGRFGALTGPSPDAAVGQVLWSLVHDESRAAVQALFDADDPAGLRSASAMAVGHDGQQHHFEISVTPLREQGRVIGFAGSAVDVTAFRNAARAIAEARDAAEEASRAKSEFIANISHELRTPLQSIIGFSELGQLRGRDQPRLAAMFGDVLRAGQRMLALVNDLLDVSRIDSVVGAMHLERADLRPLVREVIDELRPLADRRHIALSLALPERSMATKVDPLRFQQVIRNVAANAIKFAPEHSVVEIRGQRQDEGLLFTVKDRGPGIPEAELESIFEAFVQSSKTKDGSGGTGLGLAICRKIVQAFDGSIHAENRPGGGATFFLHLPVGQAADTRPMPL